MQTVKEKTKILLPENAKKVRNILITGSPGVGKTTLVKKICAKLKEDVVDMKLIGFYTEEVRENQGGHGRRKGFDIITLDGEKAILARECTEQSNSRQPMVGKYAVNVSDFESLAIKTLLKYTQTEFVIIDEIGKMELKSKKFTSTIETLINNKAALLATIPLKATLPLVEKLKSLPTSHIYEVTKENRNNLVDHIIEVIKQMDLKNV